MLDNNKVFHALFKAKDEEELHEVLNTNSDLFVKKNWKPLGGNFSNYGVVKNQQSSPIAALIEKITNSIDAILMKKCLEKGIDPKSDTAPKSMEEAIKLFYDTKASWDLAKYRKEQAQEIQIIADGKGPGQHKGYPTSVIIYDNGEGQHPEKFESSFLSLFFETVRFFLDTGYLHIKNKDNYSTYPIQLINDTLLLYKPLSKEPGYFKELYVRTSFNDSILKVMKKYGINYPELTGTWLLVREEDYDYGTHYELIFPHAIPDSIKFSRKQMFTALEHQRIFMMSTDGIKRDYSFWYQKSRIYFKPGKWYKGKHDPMIHFYKK